MTNIDTIKKRVSTKLTPKQRIFCAEYIFDWNATRAYRSAYPGTKSDNTAAVEAHKLLRNPKISASVKEQLADLERIAGISKLKVLIELKKLGFSSIAHLHNTWITRKAFEELTDDQKACIAEIDTKVKTEYEYDPDNPKEKRPISVEYVRIKLYDKQKALESISKMLGYDAPQKIDLTNKGEKFESFDYSKLSEATLRELAMAIKLHKCNE